MHDDQSNGKDPQIISQSFTLAAVKRAMETQIR